MILQKLFEYVNEDPYVKKDESIFNSLLVTLRSIRNLNFEGCFASFYSIGIRSKTFQDSLLASSMFYLTSPQHNKKPNFIVGFFVMSTSIDGNRKPERTKRSEVCEAGVRRVRSEYIEASQDLLSLNL